MANRKRLGIMTSGGDCPGLNAVIRAVVIHATQSYGWEVVGIPYATCGLMERKTVDLYQHNLDLRGIDPLLNIGGTILGSINKGDTLAHADEILAGYRELGLDGLVAIGGDGSLAILNQLAQRGQWNLVGIPKTIDNDVALTERSIGFDTALNTITDAINRLTFTAASHDRVMVIEVMGRTTGHLALHAGIAGGADVILIPEIPYTIHGICKQLTQLRDRWGRKFAIVVVAEGIKPVCDQTYLSLTAVQPTCGMGNYIASEIIHCSAAARGGDPVDVRVSVLGHIQRGGIPLAFDRLMAAAFGKAAVDVLVPTISGQSAPSDSETMIVTWQKGEVKAIPLVDVLALSPALVDPDGELVHTARGLGIYVGETPQAVAQLPTVELNHRVGAGY